MYWVLALLVPALCMRSFAEERKVGTLETMLTLPVGEREIALGKLLADLSLIGATFVLSLVLPVTFALISGLYLPEVFVGYLGLVLVSGMFTTLSLYISLKTSNQVLAFFISAVILFLSICFLNRCFGLIHSQSYLRFDCSIDSIGKSRKLYERNY